MVAAHWVLAAFGEQSMSDVYSGSKEDKEEELPQEKKKGKAKDFTGMCFMVDSVDVDDIDEDRRGRGKNTWFVDSGCSRHMTGDSRWFTSFTRSTGDDFITFGDDTQGQIEGTRSIRVNDKFILKDVALVDKLSFQAPEGNQ